ncbi:MAG: hypothetical protein ACM3ZE_24315 [Myxococcales bacterium]
MKSQLKLSDTPEADDFFRRGDEQLHVADSLQPTVSFDDADALTDPRLLRTPAQRRRRARLIKLVSLIMVFLTIGAAGAFIGTLKKHEERGAMLSLLARGATTAKAKSEVVSASAAVLDAPPSVPSTTSLVSNAAGDAASAEAAAPPTISAAVSVDPGVADEVAAGASSESSAEVAGLGPVPAESTTESEAGSVEEGPQENSAVGVVAAKSIAGAIDPRVGGEPSDTVAVASATPSASKAALPEKKTADRSAAKSSSRVRAAAGRRHVSQVNRKGVAKPEEVRTPESNPPPVQTPSAKPPEEYRPPTATFADD